MLPPPLPAEAQFCVPGRAFASAMTSATLRAALKGARA